MTITDQLKDELFRQYGEKVKGYIQSKTGDPYLAEDLCSEVFIKVYANLETFDERRSSLSTWIFTITRNRLTDYYRTRRVFSEVPETVSTDDSFVDDLCRDEMLETLADALEALDERARSIIVLHYYAQATLKDIAEKLGISYAYVKILHNKALAQLKIFF